MSEETHTFTLRGIDIPSYTPETPNPYIALGESLRALAQQHLSAYILQTANYLQYIPQESQLYKMLKSQQEHVEDIKKLLLQFTQHPGNMYYTVDFRTEPNQHTIRIQPQSHLKQKESIIKSINITTETKPDGNEILSIEPVTIRTGGRRPLFEREGYGILLVRINEEKRTANGVVIETFNTSMPNIQNTQKMSYRNMNFIEYDQLAHSFEIMHGAQQIYDPVARSSYAQSLKAGQEIAEVDPTEDDDWGDDVTPPRRPDHKRSGRKRPRRRF